MLSHEVVYAIGGKAGLSGISGDVGRADRARSDRTYSWMSEHDAALERGRASIVYGSAVAAHADLLVTTRPFLMPNSWFRGRGTICSHPQDAIALIGQFLRSRGEFRVRAPVHNRKNATLVGTGKSTFYWVAARAMLPSGWRWQEECRAYDEMNDHRDIGTLALSVFQRLSRCLIARDSARWLDYLNATRSVIDDLMSTLDTVLMNLVGAYDAVARVSNQLLAIDAPGPRVGWQKEPWLAEARAKVPALAAIIEPDSPQADLFEVLRRLRNTVHEVPLEPLGPISSSFGGAAERTALRLPRRDARRIAEILSRRGWVDSFGLEDWGELGILVSPIRLMEHSIPAAAATLDRMMAVPLSGHRSSDRPSRPVAFRANPDHELFSPQTQRDVLMQLGLNDTTLLGECSCRDAANIDDA